MADEILLQGVQGITDLITTPGLINTDFADVKMILTNAGSALMGVGYGHYMAQVAPALTIACLRADRGDSGQSHEGSGRSGCRRCDTGRSPRGQSRNIS